MLQTFTARYTKIDSGYMGQLVEWPEVITEGENLEDCREMLRDALAEMIHAYRDLGQAIPRGTSLLESLAAEVGDDVRQTA